MQILGMHRVSENIKFIIIFVLLPPPTMMVVAAMPAMVMIIRVWIIRIENYGGIRRNNCLTVVGHIYSSFILFSICYVK
jgi:hypothetical protein